MYYQGVVIQIKTKYIQSENLIIQKMSGDWSFEDFQKNHAELLQDPYLDHVENGIVDLREVNIDINLDELSQLEEYRKALDQNIKAMLVVNHPSSTAVALLFTRNLQEYPVEYCSTIEHAVKCLELNIDAHDVEEAIKQAQES